jgi:hypothetical protein
MCNQDPWTNIQETNMSTELQLLVALDAILYETANHIVLLLASVNVWPKAPDFITALPNRSDDARLRDDDRIDRMWESGATGRCCASDGSSRLADQGANAAVWSG